MSLTSYQQAVLQEMGIPVWITKDAYTELKQEDQAKQNNANAAQRNVGIQIVHRHSTLQPKRSNQ